MNIMKDKSLSELIQLNKDKSVVQENGNEFLTTVKNEYAESLKMLSGLVRGNQPDINFSIKDISAPIASQNLSSDEEKAGVILNFNSATNTETSAASGLFYKQESVISIIRDFPHVNYNIDFTSANINQADCRNLMKYVLAIVISEEEDIISEDSVETTLSLLDIPIFFNFALNNILGLFKGFVEKLTLSNQYLYLVDAKNRWTSGIYLKREMAFGEIPCDFSVKKTFQGGKFIAEITLLLRMFGKSYELITTVNENDNQVETMSLKVAAM